MLLTVLQQATSGITWARQLDPCPDVNSVRSCMLSCWACTIGDVCSPTVCDRPTPE